MPPTGIRTEAHRIFVGDGKRSVMAIFIGAKERFGRMKKQSIFEEKLNYPLKVRLSKPALQVYLAGKSDHP